MDVAETLLHNHLIIERSQIMMTCSCFLIRKPSAASSIKSVSMVASLNKTEQNQQSELQTLNAVGIKDLNSHTAAHCDWNNDRV